MYPMNFTHAFFPARGAFLTIDVAVKHLRKNLREEFQMVYDMDRVAINPVDGRLMRETGGWSYGHIQDGFMCAGAGGLNSLPVAEL